MNRFFFKVSLNIDDEKVEVPVSEQEKTPADFSEYEAWRSSDSLTFYKIGGLGMLIWAFALLIYELYYWFGGVPGLDYILGMTIISLVIGLGATLTVFTGIGLWRYHDSKLALSGFILSLLFGWIIFASDVLDLIYGMNTFLLLWGLGYIVMGILITVWGAIMISAEEVSGYPILAKYGGYALFFGGFIYLTFTYATWSMILVFPGLIMTAIAVLRIK
jgi:hypothetical protein